MTNETVTNLNRAPKLTSEQARFILEVLDTQGLSVPMGDTKKLRLAAAARETIEAIVGQED